MKDETAIPRFHPSSFIPHPCLSIPSVRQHSLDALLVSFGNHYINVQIPLSLVGLLGQDVTCVRMAAFDLSGRGRAKSLRRAFMCF
jgi:hypothetical protein